MEPTNTTFLTPAAFAASTCALAPSQSTSSGDPPAGYTNSMRFGVMGSKLLVHTTTHTRGADAQLSVSLAIARLRERWWSDGG